MNYAIIENGVVANIVEADGPLQGLQMVEAGSASIGDLFDGQAFAPAASAPTQAEYLTAMAKLFDATAQARNYDNRITCALRAGYAGPFQAEGIAFGQWMDACNALGYTVLSEVLQGQRAQPTLAEFMELLPAMQWPA